jgi:hypothetical protein
MDQNSLSSDDLRAAYEEVVRRRTSAQRGSCPDPAEILEVLELRADEERRLEILDHVMACSECRREFDLLRPVAMARPGRRWIPSRWLAAAASLAVLFGTGYGIWRGVVGGGESTFRGVVDPVELVLPEEGTVAAGVLEFTWRAYPGAFEYVLEVVDEDGEALLSLVSPDTSLVVSPELRAGIEGAVIWWVRARLTTGGERRSEARSLEFPAP